MQLKNHSIKPVKEFFEGLLNSNSLTPSFIVKNLSSLNKVDEDLTKKIEMLNNIYKEKNEEGSDKLWIYSSLDGGQSIKPYLVAGESVIYNAEKINDLIKAENEILVPHFVNPSKFNEYVEEYNKILFSDVEDLKVYKISEAEVNKAEQEGKVTAEQLATLHTLGYYEFE